MSDLALLEKLRKQREEMALYLRDHIIFTTEELDRIDELIEEATHE